MCVIECKRLVRSRYTLLKCCSSEDPLVHTLFLPVQREHYRERERDCVSLLLTLPSELHLYPNLPFLHHKCHTLNGCTAQFEIGFGSVCSIHSAAALAPADVFLPMAIIKFHKYLHHKVSI